MAALPADAPPLPPCPAGAALEPCAPRPCPAHSEDHAHEPVAPRYHCKECGTPYCSRECQLRDWKNGHRAFCSQAKELQPELDELYRKYGLYTNGKEWRAVPLVLTDAGRGKIDFALLAQKHWDAIEKTPDADKLLPVVTEVSRELARARSLVPPEDWPGNEGGRESASAPSPAAEAATFTTTLMKEQVVYPPLIAPDFARTLARLPKCEMFVVAQPTVALSLRCGGCRTLQVANLEEMAKRCQGWAGAVPVLCWGGHNSDAPFGLRGDGHSILVVKNLFDLPQPEDLKLFEQNADRVCGSVFFAGDFSDGADLDKVDALLQEDGLSEQSRQTLGGLRWMYTHEGRVAELWRWKPAATRP